MNLRKAVELTGLLLMHANPSRYQMALASPSYK
mgnify:CR=1 FL=1